MHPMGTRILALAPRAQELAVAVEHHHRVLAAIEHVDVVPSVDTDRADFLERPALGEPRPVLDDAVPVLAAPDDDRHAPLPFRLSGSARISAMHADWPGAAGRERGPATRSS